MRASEVLIAWTPAGFDLAETGKPGGSTAGCVELIQWPADAERARAFGCTVGAACPEWRAAAPETLAARVMAAFNTMVLRDGISPLIAHIALLDLQEYRDNLCPELQPQAPPVASATVVDLSRYRIRHTHRAAALEHSG